MQTSSSLPQADTVGERYVLLERIGEGTFAITYRARDVLLDRVVALKLLRPQYAADATFLARFSREARTAAKVNHPNVVHVYDYGTRDDTPYLVLQYVPGRDLKASLTREGPYPPEEAVRIARQILHGLDAIHREGLIHRDVKPQNILLGFDQTARVADFGIAHNPANSLLTGYGTTLGTPSYMAPEQARGESVTKAADLYAVGVLLFELLTGRLPFTGENPLAVMLAHVQDTPPTPSELAPNPIPPALDAIVLRALAKDPKDRYLSAAEMAHALEDWQSEPLVTPFDRVVVPPSIPLPTADTDTVIAPTAPIIARPIPPPPRARRWLALLAPLGVLALIVGIVAGVLAMGDDKGNDDGNTTGRLGAGFTPTTISTLPVINVNLATETPVPSAAATDVPPSPTPTAPDTATATSPTEPTEIPPPTKTARPARTPRPTRTPIPPTPEPSTDEQPTIAPSDNNRGQSESEEQPSEPVTLSFGPEDWQGGFYRGNSGFLGRPWVAIYGAQSGLGQISLTFSLDNEPTGEATLTITGINDEWASPNPMIIAVNGVEIYNGPCPFPAWDGSGNGHDAVWGTTSWTIPAGTLTAGTNEVTIRNLTDSGNTNSPPYIDISTTTLEVH